jgi:hypothetical protein
MLFGAAAEPLSGLDRRPPATDQQATDLTSYGLTGDGPRIARPGVDGGGVSLARAEWRNGLRIDEPAAEQSDGAADASSRPHGDGA